MAGIAAISGYNRAMPALIPILRLLSVDQFVSGTEIAGQQGISRASVSAALALAEDYGVALERRHGLGYRLLHPIDWLQAEQIQKALPAHSPFQVHVCDEIQSTNRALLAQPQHGQVLAAEWQHAGRGRMGRSWLAPLGGSLMFSLTWSFPGGPAQLAGLPLAVGVVVGETLQALGVRGLGLKWPNDLLLPEGKVSGILIEMQGDALGPADVVVGIGLNLSMPAFWRSRYDRPVATLQEAGLQVGRNALLSHLLVALAQLLQDFSRDGFAAIRPRWEGMHAWQGLPGEIILPNGQKQEGCILGVDDSGSLRLETRDGIQFIHAGDVSLRRRTQ